VTPSPLGAQTRHRVLKLEQGLVDREIERTQEERGERRRAVQDGDLGETSRFDKAQFRAAHEQRPNSGSPEQRPQLRDELVVNSPGPLPLARARVCHQTTRRQSYGNGGKPPGRCRRL